MKILNIIDSLELNGGSTFFLEMSAAMQKHWTSDEIISCVVSKTGQMGRKGLISNGFASSYDIDIQIYDYKTFEQHIVPTLSDAVIFHHVLGHTKNIIFGSNCKSIIINHTVTNIHRLKKFRANVIVCVSSYFTNKAKSKGVKSRTIINGCDNYFDREPKFKDKRFVIGVCQRIVPSKFQNEKISVKNCIKYIIGPNSSLISGLSQDAKVFGPIFDRNKKLSIVKSFDIYLHSSIAPEGASMAILEALSCGVPVVARRVGGGIIDLISHGNNGFFYENNKDLNSIIKKLSDRNYLDTIKKQVKEDFKNRFDIKLVLEKYRELMSVC